MFLTTSHINDKDNADFTALQRVGVNILFITFQIYLEFYKKLIVIYKNWIN